MNIRTLPVTSGSKEIQDNFLQHLSQRVIIKGSTGNAAFNKFQIIIFKPTGRPNGELDNVMQVFQEQDKDVIFITAIKSNGCNLDAPSPFNFVLQTSIFLNDENKLDSRSNAAIEHIADLLIQQYGFRPESTEKPLNEEIFGETGCTSETDDVNALRAPARAFTCARTNWTQDQSLTGRRDSETATACSAPMAESFDDCLDSKGCTDKTIEILQAPASASQDTWTSDFHGVSTPTCVSSAAVPTLSGDTLTTVPQPQPQEHCVKYTKWRETPTATTSHVTFEEEQNKYDPQEKCKFFESEGSKGSEHDRSNDIKWQVTFHEKKYGFKGLMQRLMRDSKTYTVTKPGIKELFRQQQLIFDSMAQELDTSKIDGHTFYENLKRKNSEFHLSEDYFKMSLKMMSETLHQEKESRNQHLGKNRPPQPK